ncbi:MAG: DUF4838 domain-containing protein [Victivallales bacterium]|nr:DUF4838 domain-containing protein [Victivallales bacterium]
MKKLALLAVFACMLNVFAYNLDNKALTPIKHAKAEKHKALELVKDGKLQFAIVADVAQENNVKDKSKKSITMAVKVVSDAFEKCVGEKPELLSSNDNDILEKHKYLIVLGDCGIAKDHGVDFRKLPPQGFVVRTFDKGVLIVGNDTTITEEASGRGRGTLYGALDFTERFLGVRYFFPGEVGTYWPAIRDFTVKPEHYSDAPYFLSRCGTYHLWTGVQKDGIDKFGELAGGVRQSDVSFGDYYRFAYWEDMPSHSPTPEALAKAYPDKFSTIFFTNYAGKMYYNPKAHIGNLFDFTNLEFADLLVESWKKYLAGDEMIGACPRKEFGRSLICNEKVVGFGNCDTYLSNPEIFGNKFIKELNLVTDADKARPRNALMANVYGRFVKYLAERVEKEFPGKKLLFLAYYNSEYAPTDPRYNRWPSNVEIILCNAEAAPRRIMDKKVRAAFLKQTKEWTEVLGHPVNDLWLYDEYTNPYCRAVMGEFVGELPKALGKYLGNGNLFFDSGFQFPYYTSFYSAFRCMWNPDWNADAAIEEHFPLFYGEEAGRHLIRFHRLLKRDCYKEYLKQGTSVPSYPPKVIAEMESLLKQAEAAIPADSAEMRRFKIFSMPWAANFDSQHVIHAYRKPLFKAGRLASGAAIEIDGKGDEAAWKDAAPLVFINPKGSYDTPKFAPDVRLLWDDKGLYMLFRASAKPVVEKAFWDNCGYELFLMPKPHEQKYQLAFDANGKTYFGVQRVLPLPGPTDANGKIDGLRIKAEIHDDGWDCELFLPFTAFEEGAPKPNDVWRFNLVRNKLTEPREVIATSLTLGNHHNYNMFGNLQFAK